MNRTGWRSALRAARDRALASERILVLAGRSGRTVRRTAIGRLLPPVLDGLPPGLDPAVVETAIAELGGDGIRRCAHVALSGWKDDAWTSRVFVDDRHGVRRSIVCKVTDYDDHVPAFDGLPYTPGRPEYAVLRAVLADPGGALARQMPRPLVAEPLDDRRHVFAFADVGRTHGSRAGDADLLGAVGLLPSLQAAMRSTTVADDALLDLRPERHADQLARYVHDHLVTAPEAGASDLARDSDDLIARCVTPTWASDLVGPAHGDPNRSNVLFARRGDDVVFIDWEWAGLGLPHVDLACLTKAISPELEDVAVARFTRADPRVGLDEHRDLHARAKLHRSLLDASFLVAQRSARPGGVRFDIDSPIRRAHDAARQLRTGKLTH